MDASLTAVLTKLGLSSFETELCGLGVTEADDVTSLEDSDLAGIGFSVVQIRKLQRALQGGGAVASAPAQNGSWNSAAPAKRKVADTGSAKRPLTPGALGGTSAIKAFKQGTWEAEGYGGSAGSTFKNKGGGGGAANGGWTATPAPKCWDTPFERAFLAISPLSVIEKRKAEATRSSLALSIDGGEDGVENCAPMDSFDEIDVLPQYAIMAMLEMGISSPTPIQAQALPLILAGQDLVGVAKTGSGKTLAYLLPAVVHIEAQEPLNKWEAKPIALALAPTRELAVQITDQAKKLLILAGEMGSSHPGGLWAACVFGGLKKGDQIREAKGAAIIAATPGRLCDNIDKHEISMERVTYFVLDEGDRMLDDGFEDQVKTIANAIRPDRHMLFFSATWPKKVQDLAKFMCHGSIPPVRLRVGQSADGVATTREDIVQEVVVFDDGTWEERDHLKQTLLYAHVREALEWEGTKVLVFVSRKDLADEMAAHLNGEGFMSESMHGGRSQDRRLAILESFKNEEIRLLVTTDVMGRGLDIPTITHVVCYDMGDIEDYVHRIGRTARGPHGQGHALTLFEYNSKWPHLAEGLVLCLEQSGQEVPEELAQIAHEVSMGTRDVKAMKAGSKWGELSGYQGGAKEVAWKKAGYGPGAASGDWQPW